MATCSPSTTLLYRVSSSTGAEPAPSGRSRSISLPTRLSTSSYRGLCAATTQFCWRKSGLLPFASLPLRATTSEETSTDVLKRDDEVLPIREETSEETTTDTSKQFNEAFSDLKEKLDSIENKSTIFIYGSGALVTLWVSSAVVQAINSVPLFPQVMEFVGLGYTIWFVYRYLLFKQSREELAAAIEEFKQKITG